MKEEDLIVLPARNCRRSKKIIAYLESKGIPFTRIPLESPEGRELAARHGMLASPGILVRGKSINPFDLLKPPNCTVDEEAVRRLLLSNLRSHASKFDKSPNAIMMEGQERLPYGGKT